MRHTSSFAGIQMRKEYVGTQRNVGFPDSSVGKESACNAGDPSLIPRLGRSAGEGIDYPLQYSGLNNSMDYEDFIKAFVIQNTFILFSESFK